MPTYVLADGPHEGRTADESPTHPVISCMSSDGVTARHFPALKSRFASRMSFRKAVRLCSINRLERISTRDSFCGNDNPSARPTILSNVIPVFMLLPHSSLFKGTTAYCAVSIIAIPLPQYFHSQFQVPYLPGSLTCTMDYDF